MAKTTKKAEDVVEKKATEETAEEKKAVEKKKETKKTVKKEPRVYTPDDHIPCRSVTCGLLYYKSNKNNVSYEWSNFGDITNVLYSDLLAWKTSKSRYLYEPWLVIEDTELLEQWNDDLIKYYELFGNVENAEEFLQKDADEIAETLKTAPKGYTDMIMYTAAEMIREKKLDSINKINAIDEALGTQLTILL